ncbi:MAG TPA: glycosyltransferase [Caulobacteraceae bacterium]|nr:glycosyltransferase [Caulobacteraceae bacterium]
MRKTPLAARGLHRRLAARRHRKLIAASPLFDPAWYARTYPQVGTANPLDHYLGPGWAAGLRPSPWFDAAWYAQTYPDTAGVNPLAHYIAFGAAEDRDPNPVFLTRWYRQNNPASAAAATPLDHYVTQGAKAMRDPSPGFDAAWYAECHPECRPDAGADPLAHFLLVGRAAGFSPSPHRREPAGRPVSDARIETLKELQPVEGRTVALFVAHAPEGRLKPNVAPYLAALDAAGVRVVLVAATDRPFVLDPAIAERLAGAFVRDNQGYDFAAWAHAMRCEPGLFAADTLLLLNDSLIGPARPADLKPVLDRVKASPADVVGATESWEQAWHLQSFFLAFKRKAIRSAALHAFFSEIRSLSDKDEVIYTYEVPLASRLQAAGLACAALFPGGDGTNRTVFDWRALLAEGFPLVKTLTLRGAYPSVDIGDWRQVLGAAGFDLAMAEQVLAAAPPAKPPRGGWPLVRQPFRPGPARPPWKVAFIGPWAFDNGLGEASRGYLSALWRTGARLNLHPVEKPLAVHGRVAPTAVVREFDGPADVAIVHLNPDSWTLLGEEQQAVIARARARAGLWVWETDQVPAGWRPNFNRVEAIWAPSRYGAEVFRGQTRARISVVPHVVPVVPAPDPAGRAAVLQDLGLAPDARLVLYAFDGSSYLERKNPEALVRAFSASGLAGQGWRLVLKAKELMTNPEDGAALAALAERTAGVSVIDRKLTREDMAALFAAADVYASPHRSEGFGLTIAEAMAQGKLVVASDHGGSTDFLDAGCGFPVPVRPAQPVAAAGHYAGGGTWAEADETAFADALRAAAALVSAGDRHLGQAARARIAERLSADAVAQAVRHALDDLMADVQGEHAA